MGKHKHIDPEDMPMQRHDDYKKDLAQDSGLAERESMQEKEQRVYNEFIARGEGNSSLGLGSQLPQLNIRHIPPGWEYSIQAAMNMNGDGIDYQQLNILQNVGWEIVPASQHPEISRGDMEMSKKYIAIGFGILMMRPISVAKIDKERSLRGMINELASLGDISKEKFTGSSRVTPETSIKKEGNTVQLLSQDLSQYTDPISMF